MSTRARKEPSRISLVNELSPFIEERIAWFHQMQETQPVRYRPEYNLWEVFRYKDVEQVLLDYATFSAEKKPAGGLFSALGMSDPPRHRQLRRLVSQAFTPRRIEELAPRLSQIIDELLELAIARGKMDVVAELAYPLPVRIIAEMLGLPPDDQERFLQWSYQLFRQMLGVLKPDNNELVHYFSGLLDERKCAPHDDLMSALLAAEENGVHLTREEIVYLCMELMMAGNVSTTMLLSSALARLCQHPEIYQALHDDPSLISGTIEETLRYDFSTINAWRSARHDTVLGGQQIKADQYVVAWVAAANFDETYFPKSSQFDIRRSPNPHVTFGHGIHVCLGYPLVRLEGRIALERIVAHFSDIRLDPEKPIQFLGQMGSFRIMQALDVLLTPVTR